MSQEVRHDKSTTLAGVSLTPRAVVGLLIALLGVVLTLDRLNLIDANRFSPFWPLVIVVIGAVKYGQSRSRGGHHGLVLMFIGGWLFLNTIGVTRVPIWQLFWPVVLIVIGVNLVRQTSRRRRGRADWARSWSGGTQAGDTTAAMPNAEPNDRLSLVALLSGVRRASSATHFMGGDILAFMGGTNLDLRQATIPPGEEAVIDIFAVMAGTEITVPPSWTVVTPLVPVMGGIEDKRLPQLATAPPAPGTPAPPRLVLRGFILMSGIQIKRAEMHPILARLERLAAYLGAWFITGTLVSFVLTKQGLSWPEALVLTLPPFIAYAFVCLSAWYVCRAMPLTTSGVSALLTASVVAAFFAGSFWWLLTYTWIALLESIPALAPITQPFRDQMPFLLAVSVMIFLLVLSLHYVVLGFEAFRAAERQQLELTVLSRDAELRALRAQINPHFLYNSLNSISALTGSDPTAARRMCLLLADFMRATLHMSAEDRISLRDELTLAERFLSIEQVRFGSRLQVEQHVDAAATACRVPPLLLQPLIENAVAHGIAGLVEGGVIRIEITHANDRLAIVVENPRDPDAAWPARGGVGLENVQRRLAMAFGGAARIDTVASPGRFRVSMDIPCGADD